MTPHQAKVKRYESDVREAEANLREAESNLKYGCDRIRARAEEEINQLKGNVARCQARLDKEKVSLEEAKQLLEKGYE